MHIEYVMLLQIALLWGNYGLRRNDCLVPNKLPVLVQFMELCTKQDA